MSELDFARAQMGLSLAFHIVFAAVGVALPALMVIAEWRGRRTGDAVYLELARRWSKGTAILFAVGAVSGTVLSFELGLLWPHFMAFAGAIIGLPFSLEGFAFFTEAIFLGIYLYGWDRTSPRLHLWSGIIVAISGAASALFVVLANAWMNTPVGFMLANGIAQQVDPIAAMRSPAALHEVLHALIASYQSTAFALSGVHAALLLREPTSLFHQRALAIGLSVGAVMAVLQPISGDVSARAVARLEPIKLAAMEGQFHTERGAPLRIGGLPDITTETTPFAIQVPNGLSLIAFHDPHAEVRGLDAFAKRDWPPVRATHLSFQTMVGCGMAMLAIALWAALLRWRRRPWPRAFLLATAICGPLGFVALEAGWLVTEEGRQPWIIAGVMRTFDAVTPFPALAIPFWIFTTVYLFLAAAVAYLLWHQILKTDVARDDHAGA